MKENDFVDELRRGWAVMPLPKAQSLASFILPIRVEEDSCRIAIDSLRGRHLLVPVGSHERLSDSEGANLDARVRELIFDGRQGRYVDLFCIDASLYEEFDEVVLDVLDEVSRSETPGAEAIACVDRWRRLFRANYRTRVTSETEVGLFAELTVFQKLSEGLASFSAGMWTGPHRTQHDFELSDRCLEVKGLTERSESVVVHGLDQLATHSGRPLRLILVVLGAHENGRTLNELVDELVRSTGNVAELNELLARAGWIPGTYESRFQVSELLIMNIDATSPVLTSASLLRGSLPQGIDGVTYRLSVDSVRSMAVPIQPDQLVNGICQ